MRVRLLYFASLRDAARTEHEDVDATSATLGDLYDDAQCRHGFALPRERVRVAHNGSFADWSSIPAAGDEVAFMPPVSGG